MISNPVYDSLFQLTFKVVLTRKNIILHRVFEILSLFIEAEFENSLSLKRKTLEKVLAKQIQKL